MTVPEMLAGFGWMPDGPLLAVTRGGRLLRQQAGHATEVASPLSGGPRRPARLLMIAVPGGEEYFAEISAAPDDAKRRRTGERYGIRVVPR
jgi:hypothetical protein